MAANALTGSDIKESTLGSRFVSSYTAVGETAPSKVASAGGLEVYTGCDEDVDVVDHYPVVTLRSTVDGAKLTMQRTIGTAGDTSYVVLNENEEFSIAGTLTSGQADVLFSTPSGKVVEAHLGWAGLLDAGSNTCFMHGVVIG